MFLWDKSNTPVHYFFMTNLENSQNNYDREMLTCIWKRCFFQMCWLSWLQEHMNKMQWKAGDIFFQLVKQHCMDKFKTNQHVKFDEELL